MNLQQIENLSFAELKQDRSAILEALKSLDPAEIQERYLQARTDAKQRDEKLGEQGRLITVLQTGHDAAVEKSKRLEAERDESVKHLGETLESLKNNAEMRRDLERQVTSEFMRAERMKAEATRASDALTAAEKALKDAIAARQLDQIEKG